jgi:hypothetical protein
MFRKSYSNIMKSFSKAQEDLKAYISQEANEVVACDDKINDLRIKKDRAYYNSEKAQKSLKQIEKILGN